MPRDRSRLWDSFKKALGSTPRETERAPETAKTTGAASPFLPPDDVDAAPVPPPAATVPPVSEALPAEVDTIATGAPNDALAPAPPPDSAAPRQERLARGLASFSRHNADRERKFRHILSDDEGGGSAKKR